MAGLRRLGVDVVTATEARTLGWPDAGQLALATERGLVLVTADEGDFERLSANWLEAGLSHAGIVVVRQRLFSRGEQIRRLQRVATEATFEDLLNRVEYLSRWEIVDPEH